MRMYNSTKPYKHHILSLIRQTWHTPYVDVEPGAYPVVRKKFSFPEVQHTDGIGTKGIYHWKARTFRAAVLDALAMNLNDLLLVRATPYALQNHIVLPKDDHGAILSILRVLVRECKKRNIAMTGGETSIHNDAKGLDISITVSGFIRKKSLPNRFRIGDTLIGFKSSGLHANGFTKVREVLGEPSFAPSSAVLLRRGTKATEGKRVRAEFVRSTMMYAGVVQHLLSRHRINGMMHITGGAFTKLKDLLVKADAYIAHPVKLKPHRIFHELYQKGVSSKAMYTTFNCGIGFVVSLPPEDAERIMAERHAGVAIIGKVVKGEGRVNILSAFDGRLIML